jgi:hypothetical protein
VATTRKPAINAANSSVAPCSAAAIPINPAVDSSIRPAATAINAGR